MEQLATVSNYSNKVIDDYFLAHEQTILSWTPFIVAVPIYLVFLLIGTLVMRKRSPVNCNKALGYHNLILFVLSVAMFVGSVGELIVSFFNNGFYETYCGGTIPGQDNIYKGRLWFWAFLFYASKVSTKLRLAKLRKLDRVQKNISCIPKIILCTIHD